MLTDHVGNLKKKPIFEHANYKLQAPNYQWLLMGLGVVLDPFLNFFLLFAYIFLFAYFPFSNGGKNQSIAIVVLLISFLGVVYQSCRLKWAASLNSSNPAACEKSRRLRVIFLLIFCFYLTSTATIWIPELWLGVGIGIAMVVSGAFVAARRHRYRHSANPAFRWLLLALLSVSAVGTVRYFDKTGWFAPLLVALAMAGLLIGMSVKISKQNRWNLIFKAYRICLTARFLPFATWLTDNRPLYATGQSWNPYPIINAAANVGTHLEAFELTPLYSGHSFSGYHSTKKWLPGLTLADAMAISGGAFDFLKKTASLPSLLGALLGGTDYWIPKQGRPDRPAMLSLERLLSVAGIAPTFSIRLSDGGFVENLGVLALVKRRVKLIVCLDAGYDPDYKFEDLRKLSITLQTLGLGRLHLDDIGTISQMFRFRQNTSSILRGAIHYPSAPGAPAETAAYVHIKISSAGHTMQGRYVDFPHLTTLDQRLTDEEISALYKLGQELTDELYSAIPDLTTH